MSICNKDHRNIKAFDKLPDSQGGLGRHKCAGCAYEKGAQDALDGKNFVEGDESVLDDLPESQASYVRHKDAMAAYKAGYFAIKKPKI